MDEIDTEVVGNFKEKIIENEMLETDERAAYDNIGIQDKLIEPDSKISGNRAVSNFQLGNISTHDYYENLHEVNFALDCLEMPFEKGGWFLAPVGDKIFKKLDLAHIMSGSKGAKKWDSLTQSKKINVLETRKGSESKMDMFKRRK